MQNSASCFKQSSIGQFPANLRRWKPLDRTAQWDRFINDCIKTCGSQIRILIRSRILKKSKETSFKNVFPQIIPHTATTYPLMYFNFLSNTLTKISTFLKIKWQSSDLHPCAGAHPGTEMETGAPWGRSVSTETSAPTSRSASTEMSEPVDIGAPMDTVVPMDMGAPVDTDVSVDPSAPEDTNAPKDTNAPNDKNAPEDTKAIMETSALMNTGAPLDTRTSMETKAIKDTSTPMSEYTCGHE